MQKTKGFWNEFANFALERPRNSILLMLVMSFLPVLSYFAPAVMCLVTLRKGRNAGLSILVWGLLPYVALFSIGVSIYDILVDSVATLLLPFSLSLILRQYSRWLPVFSVLTVTMMLGLVLASMLVPHYPEESVHALQMAMKTLWQGKVVLNSEQLQIIDDLKLLIPYVFAIKSGVLVGAAILNIMLARYLQSLLFYPGGFKREIYAIRLNLYWVILYLPMIAAWAFLPSSALLIGLIFTMSIPFIISGFSVIHSQLSKKSIVAKPFVVLGYVLFVLFMYYSFFPVILYSILDVLKMTRIRKKADLNKLRG